MDVPESGRVTDPATAPYLPVDVFIHAEAPAPIIVPGELYPVPMRVPPTWLVRISAWNRAADEIIELKFQVVQTEDNPVTMTRRPPSDEDMVWLKNIGAFGKEPT